MVAPNFNWLYVLSGILFSSLAQICMKRATLFEAKQGVWLSYLAGSLSCYLLSFIAYYLALKYFSISKVSPIMTVGVVLIVVAYGIWAGETVTARHAFGLFFGAVSIFLILS